MGLQDNLYQKIKNRYQKKSVEWNFLDTLMWRLIIYVLPFLFLIPLYFRFLKWIFIDLMLNSKGFEYTIIILCIIFMISPLGKHIMNKVSESFLESKYELEDSKDSKKKSI